MTRRRGIAELLLFLLASAAGIYAFGRGLAGFFGMHADPLWLPVGFAALWVLAKQMGRIQDRWPRRKQARRTPAADGQTQAASDGAPVSHAGSSTPSQPTASAGGTSI